MTPSLYAHQKEWLEKHSRPGRYALWWEGGVGKTPVGCLFARMHGDALVVCPKGLVINWQKELAKWGASAVVISKEDFKKYARPHRTLIVDEADHFASANFKSALSKRLREYLKKNNPSLLLLTATPYRSTPWNIYTLATYLGHQWNFREFEAAFFNRIWMGQRQIPVINHKAAPRLKRAIAKIGDVRTLAECTDVPDDVDETIEVGETPEQKKAKEDIIDVAAIAIFTAEHKIEAGGNKVERIIRLCQENKKIAIVCRFREQLEELGRAIADETGKSVFFIHGGISTANRQSVVETVREMDEVVVLLQSATCEGYSLESIPTMVFASMDYSYRNYRQMRWRIQRINAVKKNLYIHLISGDADRAIMDAMLRHEDFDVLRHMKART